MYGYTTTAVSLDALSQYQTAFPELHNVTGKLYSTIFKISSVKLVLTSMCRLNTCACSGLKTKSVMPVKFMTEGNVVYLYYAKFRMF